MTLPPPAPAGAGSPASSSSGCNRPTPIPKGTILSMPAVLVANASNALSSSTSFDAFIASSAMRSCCSSSDRRFS